MKKSLMLVALLSSFNVNAAELLSDGGFESYTVSSGNFIHVVDSDCGVSATCVIDDGKAWQAGIPTVPYYQYVEIQNNLLTPAYNGNNYAELNAFDQGGITQTFNAVAGLSGVISWYAQRPNVDALFRTTDKNIATPYSVIFNGVSYAYNPSESTIGDWDQISLNITGDKFLSTGNTLSFVSGVPTGSTAILLDNVSVTQVPEPETYGMMIAGLAMLGFVSRRRRRA